MGTCVHVPTTSFLQECPHKYSKPERNTHHGPTVCLFVFYHLKETLLQRIFIVKKKKKKSFLIKKVKRFCSETDLEDVGFESKLGTSCKEDVSAVLLSSWFWFDACLSTWQTRRRRNARRHKRMSEFGFFVFLCFFRLFGPDPVVFYGRFVSGLWRRTGRSVSTSSVWSVYRTYVCGGLRVHELTRRCWCDDAAGSDPSL